VDNERPGSSRFQLTTRPLFLALVFWIAVAIAVAVRTILSPNQHTVFPIFAASADHWWSGESLYAIYPPLDQFRYPPPFAVAVAPFSALGPRVGAILWVWFSMAVYGAGLWCFAQDVLPVEWTTQRKAGYLFLGVVLALPGIWNAQSNALVIGLVLLAASCLVRERWWTSAGLLAATVCIKLTPVAPALLLCALWPRKLVPRFALALVLGSLIPFLTSSPTWVLGQYSEWATHLVDSGTTRWPGFRDGWTLWLTVRHLVSGAEGPVPALTAVDSPIYRILQVLGAGATLAWCLWQRTRGHSTRWLVCVTLSMGMAWLMLFGPSVEHSTYVFLAPSLAWGFLDCQAWPRGRWLFVLAFWLIAALGWEPSFLIALPLGAMLFAIWLIGYARSSLPVLFPGTVQAQPLTDRWPSLSLLAPDFGTQFASLFLLSGSKDDGHHHRTGV
jgi:alpha-1,2-mannosyltransferase